MFCAGSPQRLRSNLDHHGTPAFQRGSVAALACNSVLPGHLLSHVRNASEAVPFRYSSPLFLGPGEHGAMPSLGNLTHWHESS
jgi:hypothetical protein